MAGEMERSGPHRPRDELVRRFIDLSNEVSAHIRPKPLDIGPEIELTLHQFRTLSMLSRGPLRVSDIAARLGVRLSSANNLIERLENKELLERIADPDDQRVIWCRLTSAGLQETENLWHINLQILESVTDSLTTEELQTVVETFEVLSSALRRNGPATPR